MENVLIVILNIFFISFLNQINGQPMELIAGHVLYRHGDRTPVRTYPSDPIQAKDWPNGWGQLTTLGIQQQYRLGKYLRNRYGSILSLNYIPSEIYVRSTNVRRTLMSAQSNLIGLYPYSDISKNTIPIHTVPSDQDFLLGYNDCPRQRQVRRRIAQSDEIDKLDAYYQPFFKKLRKWTNIPDLSIYNDASVSDTTLIEYIHNKAPAWADEHVRRNLSDIRDFHCQFVFSNNDINRIRGGPLIKDIWMNMNNSIHGRSYWKVKTYSAHDITVSPVLFFLGIKYRHLPQYASAVFVDLYKQNSSYFVKVAFLNVTDSNIAYPYVLPGCPAFECPFETFTSLYEPRFPASADIECIE